MASRTTSRPEVLRGAAYSSPLGNVVAVASERGLRSVGFDLDALSAAEQAPSPVLDAFGAWLSAYLTRPHGDLPEVPLDVAGTDFERTVWDALITIGPGRMVTYGELANRLKRPNASRAVGAACGRNKVALVVPCHRVVASNGSLHGYAGGVERKAWLLKHEGALLL